MSKIVRMLPALVVAVLLSGSVGLAQAPGEASYTAKCTICHGATGMAETAVGKALKIKPVTDPAVKAMSREKMIEVTRDGIGKMQSFGDKLPDAELQAAVNYFRSMIK